MPWLDQAKQLPEGKKTRVRCCKSDRSMIISNSNSGYGAYCFRCGFNEFEPHGERSISQILKGKAETEFISFSRPLMPQDRVSLFDASPEAQAWVLKAGVSLAEASQKGICYSPAMDRVILPIYDTSERILGIQARAMGNGIPKYLNSIPRSKHLLYKCFNTQYKFSCGIVVEDILSAIKIQPIRSSISILGTNMTQEKAHKISLNYKKILLWFDDDEAGERCRKTSKKQLELQGIEFIRDIRTEKDPKCYSHKEIEGIIHECLISH